MVFFAVVNMLIECVCCNSTDALRGHQPDGDLFPDLFGLWGIFQGGEDKLLKTEDK